MRTRARIILACCIAALPILGSASVQGASTEIIVELQALSATSISLTACSTGTPGVTEFGAVLKGDSHVTDLDCTVEFGSTNDTARLHVAQDDGLGRAMWQPTRGELDPGFAGDGKLTIPIAPGSGSDAGYEVLLQPDGKLVAVGRCNMGGATGNDFCLARINPDGTLDTSFAGDGTLTVPIAPGSGTDDARAAALQDDGRIVIAGWCAMGSPTGNDFCLARINPDGTLDTSFAGDGTLTIDIAPGSGHDYARAVAIQPNGRIVVGGYCNMGAPTGWDFCAARVTTDGVLDTTFAGDGKLSVPIAPGSGVDEAWALAIQPDGRIVMAGHCQMGGTTGEDKCLARINPNGTLDTTFAAGGTLTIAIAPGTQSDHTYAVTLQPDGRIITAGRCNMGGTTGIDICMSRINPDGALDTSFAGDGTLTFPIAPGTGQDWAFGVAVQPDGRILVAGECQMGGATGWDMCAARLNPSGTLDNGFGIGGRTTIDIAPADGPDRVWDLAVLPDGRAVIFGMCDMGATGNDLCLAVLDNGGEVEQYVPGTSDWTTADTSHFAACLRTMANGSATWTLNATCPASNGTFWNAIPEAPSEIARTTVPGTIDAIANLRFGARTGPDQPSGRYIAPLTFTVTAP